MRSPVALSHLTLSDLEGSNSRSLNVGSLISRKKSLLIRPMLLLNINGKPYLESPMAHSHLTLSDLERSNSRSPRLQSFLSRKAA